MIPARVTEIRYPGRDGPRRVNAESQKTTGDDSASQNQCRYDDLVRTPPESLLDRPYERVSIYTPRQAGRLMLTVLGGLADVERRRWRLQGAVDSSHIRDVW